MTQKSEYMVYELKRLRKANVTNDAIAAHLHTMYMERFKDNSKFDIFMAYRHVTLHDKQ